jgi:hypothetical protein
MNQKWYGSLNNRLEENKKFCDKIEKGTLLTEYLYSDKHAYEVVEVLNQKHVKVRKLDPIKKKGSDNYDNEWTLISNPKKPIRELKFRYGKWNWVRKFTKESINDLLFIPEKIAKDLQTKDTSIQYSPTNVSFGIGEYYYDYTY